MQMLDYIAEIQRQLVTEFGLPPREDAPYIPSTCPDGTYPMTIDGKLDRVEIRNGQIFCGNFDSVTASIDHSPYVPANADEWRAHLAKYLDNRATYPHALSKMACEIATALAAERSKVSRLRDVLTWSEENCPGKCSGRIQYALVETEKK